MSTIHYIKKYPEFTKQFIAVNNMAWLIQLVDRLETPILDTDAEQQPQINYSINSWMKLLPLITCNIGVFARNKHKHIKLEHYFVRDLARDWILLFSDAPELNLKSFYLICDSQQKGIQVKYSILELETFLNDIKIMTPSIRADLFSTSKVIIKTLPRRPIKRNLKLTVSLMNKPEDAEALTTPIQVEKLGLKIPTKAGVFSRIRHAYDRNIEKWKRPTNKPHSLSRTRTFTRERIRPNEYFTREQRMAFLKAFGNAGKTIRMTSPETKLAAKQRLQRVFGLDPRKRARDEYRELAQM